MTTWRLNGERERIENGNARHSRLAAAIDSAAVRRHRTRARADPDRGAGGALSGRGDAAQGRRSGQAVRRCDRRMARRRRRASTNAIWCSTSQIGFASGRPPPISGCAPHRSRRAGSTGWRRKRASLASRSSCSSSPRRSVVDKPKHRPAARAHDRSGGAMRPHRAARTRRSGEVAGAAQGLAGGPRAVLSPTKRAARRRSIRCDRTPARRRS